MKFNENLIRERKARSFSQEDLAAKVNVSRQAISKWETGDAMPDLNNLLLLADALDISLDVLCGRESFSTPAEAPRPQKKSLLLLLLIPLAALSILLAVHLANCNTVPAEEASLASIPEEFIVTGLSFGPAGSDDLEYEFTPSISGEGLTYSVTFNGSFGSYTFDAPCIGGVCTGIADFSDYNDSMTVTVSVTDGISSRNLAVAMNLTYSNTSCSWTPLTE